MEHHEYFRHFLNIEEDLIDFTKQLTFDKESINIYSPKLSLLLLQTCPVIESYMVDLSTKSDSVKRSGLWRWQYKWRLWSKNKTANSRANKSAERSIGNFPKFAYVCEKVFRLSDKEIKFYFSDKLQNLPDDAFSKSFKPFEDLSEFIDYRKIDYEPLRFPTNFPTPAWWQAYNKIKHDLELSKKKVKYDTVIETVAGLFLILAYCDTDMDVLGNNGYIKSVNGKKKAIKSKLFECEI